MTQEWLVTSLTPFFTDLEFKRGNNPFFSPPWVHPWCEKLYSRHNCDPLIATNPFSVQSRTNAHKGDDKSSLDRRELQHEEGDRSSLEPLSFGITSGIPSYQSSLDLNPVWIRCKCIIKEMTNPVWTQWNCTIKKVTDPVWNHSHLALLLILQATNPVWIQSHSAILLIRQAVKDWLWIHCHCAIKEHTNPINFKCHCTIKGMTNPVWIQCRCTIKEMTNPVWIQWNFTKKNVTDPVWIQWNFTVKNVTDPVWNLWYSKLPIQSGYNANAP